MSKSQGLIVLVVVMGGIAMWLAVVAPGTEVPEEEASIEPIAGQTAQPPNTYALGPKIEAAPSEPLKDAPAEADSPSPAPAAPAGPTPWPQGDLLAGSKGPIDEYRDMYNQQARDNAATEVENGIRQAFTRSSLPDLLHSTSCHEQVCKLLIRWSPDRAKEYIKAMRGLALGASYPPGLPGFHSQIAFTSGSEPDRDGGRIVEIFLMRRSLEAMWMEKPHVRQGTEGAPSAK
ncbi:MAG TPA: hypothetical protein VMF89_30810 [Polyangiales bacterium]|nr:hypothetical protein [Polyangiales bacterium]